MTLAGEALGLLLAVGVMAATAWAVLAGGWVEGAGAAAAAGLAGLAASVLLAWLRPRRWVALATLPALLVAVVVPLTIADMPGDGETGPAHAAGRYIESVAGGFFASSDWAFVVALCAILAACGYWLGWFALRERRGVVATLPCYTLLAVNALNAPSLGRVVLPDTVAAALCLLLLAQVQLEWLRERWRRTALAVAAGTPRRFLGATLLATTAVVATAAVLPPATSRDISALLFTARVRPPQRVAPEASSPAAPPPAPAVAFSSSTVPGGPLSSRPRPVLLYTTDAPAGLYLRLVNDTVFKGGSWLPGVDGGLKGIANVTVQPRGDGLLLRDRDPGHGGVSLHAASVRATVSYLSPAERDAPYLPFLGEPDATQGAGQSIETGLAAYGSSLLLTVDRVAPVRIPEVGASVATMALEPTATEAQLRAAGSGYPAFTAGLRLLPDDGSGGAETISSVARSWTAGLANAYDQAKAIETHLRDPAEFAYDLRPDPTPSGVWPIVHFLTRSHRGYCQYFASSMGAMLRSLGIPARLVSGYGPGVAVEDAPGAPVHRVTSSDAHSWVEAYFPHYGWIAFEPTPPSGLGDYQPLPRGGPDSRLVPSPSAGASPTASPTPSPSPAPAPAAAPPRPSRPAGGGPGPLLTVMAVAGILALALGVWWRRPLSLRGVWRRVLVLGWLLRVRRQPWETDLAYADRLARMLSGGEPRRRQALTEIAALSGRAQFSALGPRPEDRAAWRRCWRSLCGAALAALPGSLAARGRSAG